MKKILRIFLLVLLVVLIGGFFVVKYNIRDRHPGYELNLQINNKEKNQVNAGFAAVSILPEIVDTWNDADGDAKYDPDKGDTFNDNNNNGEFDAIWIAGFHSRRPANGIHDTLWARTAIFDDGNARVAMVSLDAIGFFHDQVIDIRERLPQELGIDYCIVASTHVHESPDLMGIWGESMFKSGVNENYMELVISQAVESVKKAVADLEPVSLHFSKDEKSALPLVKDTRKPIVPDPGMYIIQAKRTDGSSKGTLISWANHPETLWSKNLLISSDFPHYFREGVESKVGGTCVYFNGAVGGLLCTHPSIAIKDPITGKEIFEPSYEKTEALGSTLASIAANAIQNSTDSISEAAINLQAKTLVLPFKNSMFRIAAMIGLMDRGMTGRWKVRTEMAALQIGPASILTIPGEIYPELINGGIVAPEGQDFDMEPLEIPPLRSEMPGKFKFVFGLANDEIGYIIPKSEWDNEEPWLWNSKSDFYGEENSAGPETGPILHKLGLQLLSGLK
jgi:hypothetical protein